MITNPLIDAAVTKSAEAYLLSGVLPENRARRAMVIQRATELKSARARDVLLAEFAKAGENTKAAIAAYNLNKTRNNALALSAAVSAEALARDAISPPPQPVIHAGLVNALDDALSRGYITDQSDSVLKTISGAVVSGVIVAAAGLSVGAAGSSVAAIGSGAGGALGTGLTATQLAGTVVGAVSGVQGVVNYDPDRPLSASNLVAAIVAAAGAYSALSGGLGGAGASTSEAYAQAIEAGASVQEATQIAAAQGVANAIGTGAIPETLGATLGSQIADGSIDAAKMLRSIEAGVPVIEAATTASKLPANVITAPATVAASTPGPAPLSSDAPGLGGALATGKDLVTTVGEGLTLVGSVGAAISGSQVAPNMIGTSVQRGTADTPAGTDESAPDNGGLGAILAAIVAAGFIILG